MNAITYTLAIIVAVVLYGVIGNDDYEAEKDQERVYCEMVLRGELYNYNNVRCWEKYGSEE